MPFELHPQTPEEGTDLAAQLGIPPDRIEQMEAGLKARADELGLPLGDGRLLVNTNKALLLAEWARREAPERLDALHRALFHAYFVEGKNLAEHAVLQAVCDEVGLPSDVALAQIETDSALSERLTASRALAQAYEVRGVPAFIINNRHKISGAQPYDVFVRALQQIAGEEATAGS